MPSIEEIYYYWTEAGLTKFLRVFWYFFIVDFFRYVVVDLFAILSYMRNRKFKKRKWERARSLLWLDQPKVSVIVPGKNEGKHLYKLVRTIREQTYRHLELIVVDDGSDDDTAIIGRNLEERGMIDRFISNEVRGGKASGANTALQFVDGSFVIHLDADCSFHNDAFENILVPFYFDEDIAAVGGNLEVRNAAENLATRLQAIEYLKSIFIGRISSSYLGIYRIISGAFGAFRTDTLKRLGGWDIGPGLDGDITVKCRKLGYKVHFEPSAVGLTNVPNSFGRLAKQRLRWDKSIVRFRMRKHIDVFVPNANFRWTNMLSSAENIFFNVILNFKWYVYILDMLSHFGGMIRFIIPTNIIMYAVTNYFQFFIILFLSDNKRERLKLLWYVPLMVLYMGFYLRVVRTIAHIQELIFRKSYSDQWNPFKSSHQAKILRI